MPGNPPGHVERNTCHVPTRSSPEAAGPRRCPFGSSSRTRPGGAPGLCALPWHARADSPGDCRRAHQTSRTLYQAKATTPVLLPPHARPARPDRDGRPRGKPARAPRRLGPPPSLTPGALSLCTPTAPGTRERDRRVLMPSLVRLHPLSTIFGSMVRPAVSRRRAACDFNHGPSAYRALTHGSRTVPDDAGPLVTTRRLCSPTYPISTSMPRDSVASLDVPWLSTEPSRPE